MTAGFLPLKHKLREMMVPSSLRLQVALVVAVLSFLPNLVTVLAVLLPRVNDTSEEAARLWFLLGFWLIAVAFLSAGIGYVLSRQLLAPLFRLSVQIGVLQRRSDRLGVKLVVEAGAPQEVLALSESFDALLQQVTLEQSRRSSFLATLMHDLKTPLVATNHLLAVIRDNDTLSRDERIYLVDQILHENMRLVDLVQKMVDAHKFERNDVPLKCQPHSLEEVVAGVVRRAEPLARERGIKLTYSGQARASVDMRELERALYNLVSNAVRYARGEIKLELFPGVIRISDDGPGLPAPLEQLAQPFNAQPVEIAGQHYTAGTGGLGLFIARRIIEAHGGRLVTETTGPSGTVLLAYLQQEGV